MMKKFGPVDANDHYYEFDTICDATQERQDAISDMVDAADDLELDFILIVGGLDSSNTAHLLEIPQKAGVRSFHIDKAIIPSRTVPCQGRLLPRNLLRISRIRIRR
eukprot:715701_1